jgi:hypothetical protein
MFANPQTNTLNLEQVYAALVIDFGGAVFRSVVMAPRVACGYWRTTEHAARLNMLC